MERRSFIELSSYAAGSFLFLDLMGCTPDTKISTVVDFNDFQLLEWSIDDLQTAYSDGRLTVEKVVSIYLDRIQAIDQSGPKLNAILEINPDAISIARTLDEEMRTDQSRGPMHGVPVLLKDNIDTKDKMSTTGGSRAMAGSKPLQDSWVASQLRAAGAVILGKANLSEWANFRGENSSSGWSGMGRQVHNPYILDRNPCGSSSGSGAAVSANLCMVAIGTETNGSIVCPANNNGVVGIKPTVGLVGRSGIIPISITQDTAGPMARTLKDAAICLGALTGSDPRDAYTLASEPNRFKDYTQFLNPDGLQGKKLGLYLPAMKSHYKIDALMEQNMDHLKKSGAEIVEVERINPDNVGKEAFLVLQYEFKDGLNKYFSSLGPDAKIKSLTELIEFNKKDEIELLHFGQELLELSDSRGSLEEPEYQQALATMLKAYREDGIDRVVQELSVDAIIAPTGGPAWKTDLVTGDHFLAGSSSPAARSGYPNITVPMGMIDGLPLGISFFGPAWSEPTLLEIAYAYEQSTLHRTVPEFKSS